MVSLFFIRMLCKDVARCLQITLIPKCTVHDHRSYSKNYLKKVGWTKWEMVLDLLTHHKEILQKPTSDLLMFLKDQTKSDES